MSFEIGITELAIRRPPSSMPTFGVLARRDATFSVHDFYRVRLPFDAVAGAFVHLVTPQLITDLALVSWAAECDAIGRAVPFEPPDSEARLLTRLGELRSRQDAVVLPVEWEPTSEFWIPPVQADLELAAFGSSSSHVHLLGVSRLSPGVRAGTFRASVEQRLTIAMMRHFLGALTTTIERS